MTSDSAGLDVEARLDALFASSPDEFTATRDALVRDLRTADRPDEAATVKALRRPTVAVAALNRVAREQPELLADLVDVGDRLGTSQSDADVDRDQLRDLAQQRRAILRQLTEHAARTTERPDATRSSIGATLDAASLDRGLRDDLLRGRMTRELSPTARFVVSDDGPAGGAPATARRTTRPTRSPTPAPARDELATRRARVELDAARSRVEAVEESVRERIEELAAAGDRLQAAHRHISELEAALVRARAELGDAKRAERDAQRDERRARDEQERVGAALRAAERAVAETSRD
jgi:hypothetical protein